jgi:NADPH:quinone reductase-like Zn-dependent oxidoreductase
VLVNGASGSVGSFGLQIAKAFGTTSPAFAAQKDGDCARAGRGRGHRLHLEDYTQGGQRYDRIIDVAGNRSIFKCRPALKPRGTSCSECSTSRICACQFLGSLISLTERKKMAFLWWNPSKKKTCRSSRAFIAAGKIKPVIDRTYLIEVHGMNIVALRALSRGN